MDLFYFPSEFQAKSRRVRYKIHPPNPHNSQPEHSDPSTMCQKAIQTTFTIICSHKSRLETAQKWMFSTFLVICKQNHAPHATKSIPQTHTIANPSMQTLLQCVRRLYKQLSLSYVLINVSYKAQKCMFSTFLVISRQNHAAHATKYTLQTHTIANPSIQTPLQCARRLYNFHYHMFS